MWAKIVCLVIGYGFGLFQTGYFYGKRNGIDIRKYGSGNAGTTNSLRTLGKKAGAITLAGDCLKAILAILLVSLIFGRAFPEQIMLLKLYAGAGCVLGHNFPFYMNFKGGKGIAASVGMLIAFDWRLFFLCAVVFFTVFFLSHFVSLASLLAYFFFVVGVIASGQMGRYDVPASVLHEMYIVAFLLMLLAFWRHRANIKRLATGTENKIEFGKK